MTTRKFRAILADDEPILLDYLQQKLAQFWPELQIIATANNGLLALELIRQHQPDLVFLDIQMPGLTGLQVAGQLAASQEQIQLAAGQRQIHVATGQQQIHVATGQRQIHVATGQQQIHLATGQQQSKTDIPNCHCIFITAYDEYAVQAFEKAALDYLLKPVTDERLQHCIRRLQATLARQTSSDALPPLEQQLQQLLQQLTPAVAPLEWFHVGLAQQTKLVHLSEVIFFQACDKYTELVTRHERHLLRMSLKTLLPKLPAGQYAQVHRAYLVALAAVRYIEKDIFGRQHIHLKEHSQLLPLSRNFAGQFKQM
jgi:DNA-binding LytR/AlgR family response regulator